MQTILSNNQSTSNNDLNSKKPTPQFSNPLSKSSPSSFSPFSAKTFKVRAKADSGLIFGAVYNTRHSMIIACSSNNTMQFYDAETLLPLNERETQQLDGSVEYISFHPKTDTYLMGCTDGSIYLYNASSNELKKLKKREKHVFTVTFVNSIFYAFSSDESKSLFLGSVENEDVASFDSHNKIIYYLQHLTQQSLLLSGLDNGSVMIYRTDKLPHLRVFCSIQAHQAGEVVLIIEKLNLNGKEYIMTTSYGRFVKIWHLIKGRTRLLKVIDPKFNPDSVVYLENYKMIAMVFSSSEIKFFRFPSGKLESTVSFSKDDPHGLFLMKEKNMIGVTSESNNVVELIQLGADA